MAAKLGGLPRLQVDGALPPVQLQAPPAEAVYLNLCQRGALLLAAAPYQFRRKRSRPSQRARRGFCFRCCRFAVWTEAGSVWAARVRATRRRPNCLALCSCRATRQCQVQAQRRRRRRRRLATPTKASRCAADGDANQSEQQPPRRNAPHIVVCIEFPLRQAPKPARSRFADSRRQRNCRSFADLPFRG